MKHRNGFVSNSSSSSFIVAFKKAPESAEELHRFMFPNDMDKVFNSTYSDSCNVSDVVLTTMLFIEEGEVAQQVTPEKVLNIHQNIHNLNIEGEVAIKREYISNFFEQFKGGAFYLFTFNDCSWEYCFIGYDIFRNLPNIEFDGRLDI